MSDEQHSGEPEPAEYEAPAVEDLDVTDGPAVTAAGITTTTTDVSTTR